MKASIILAGLALFGAPAGAATTINAVHYLAYGANVGWIDFRGDGTNGAVLGRYYCTGFAYAANIGWICLGYGPPNGWQYGNAAAYDWGVNHDGAGRLSGYAWSATVGWLTFEQTWGRPRVDLRTGNLSGSVWGANIGWLSLSNATAFVKTDRLDTGPDSDGDGLPDPWEWREAGDLGVLKGGASDQDKDGSTDTTELGADTGPLDEKSNLEIVGLARKSGTDSVAWTIEPTRLYRLEYTATLTNGAPWLDSGLGAMSPDAAATMARTVADPASTTRFYRVKAAVPLTP